MNNKDIMEQSPLILRPYVSMILMHSNAANVNQLHQYLETKENIFKLAFIFAGYNADESQSEVYKYTVKYLEKARNWLLNYEFYIK